MPDDNFPLPFDNGEPDLTRLLGDLPAPDNLKSIPKHHRTLDQDIPQDANR